MPCTIRFKADLAKLVGRDSMTQDEFLAWLATGDNLAKTKELTAPPTQVKGELSEGDKANLEQIAKEVGKNFREVQNVYSKYGEGKPLSEITVEDYRKAEEKRGGEKVDDEAIGKKAGISPKNLKDLYNINRELFGLNRIQAFASAIAMDRMVGAMAKRAGVTKAEMYGRLKFEKTTEQDLPQGVKMQVDAWHGSPYQFDKFKTEKIGTGEGAQAFGWGLYFTDLESVAKDYAAVPTNFIENYNRLSETDKQTLKNKILEAAKDLLDKGEITNDKFNYLSLVVNKENSDIQDLLSFQYPQTKKVVRDFLGNKGAVYKVSLHKGKDPSEYNWLEWDKPLSEKQIDLIVEQGNKEFGNIFSKEKDGNTFYLGIKRPNGRVSQSNKGSSVYNNISEYQFNSQKETSLFLLRAGVDGIKYPAESIARGATSDTARGFNYVVFDENAVSIEEVIKFQKDALKARGAMMIALDGQAVVYALTDPNVSTPLHELAHVFEHYLTDGERAVIIKNAGTDGWTTETSEYFARGFERYLAEGKSPIAALNKVFEKFKEWLTEIYNGIKGSDIDITLNTEMKRIYDAMLGKEKITIKNTELIKKQLVAFAKGLKQGIREGKINLKEYKAKIDSFNQTLKDALKDSGLSPQWQAKMIKYFGKIKTINNLNDALLDIDKLMESEEFAEASERIKKAYKKLRKINKDRLTIADKNLISSIPQIKPRYLQDPLAWAEMLENIEKGLKQGGRRPDYKTISEIILAESQFAYDKEMAELKERTDEEWVNLSSDYEVLKTLGKLPPFVETKEQFEEYLRGVKTDEQLAKELEKQEAKEAKMSRTEELINEATWAFELDIKNNPEVLESMSARERGYYDILAKADFSKLSDVQLARLLNAFTNIKEFGDWAGVGDIAMLLSAKQAAESITPTPKSGRGIEYEKKSLNAFLRAIYNGSQVLAAQLRNKIITPWESRISKLKKKQDEVLEQVGKIINKNKLNKKDFIDISVFSFINDLLPNVDKLEQQKAILESLIESTQNMYKTFDYKGEGERKRRAEAMREKAISTAEAMKKFGLIQEYQVLPSGLKIFPKKEPNFGFQLNPKQKELYDFAVNKYAELKSGVEDFFKYQLNKQMEATDGYVARIAYKNFKTQEQKEETLKIDNYDSTNRFLSKKPSGRAKERVGGLKDGYYEMDFVEAFSKGYYENLILAEAGDAYAYMTAIVNNTSKEMTESLGEDTTKVLIGKNGFINDIVQSDKNYGYVGKDFRSLFEKAQEFVLTNAASSILKRADQIVLQTIPSLLTSIIQHPKATMMAVKVLSGKNGNTDKLMERFTAYHRVLGGQKEFEKKILSLGKNKFIEAGEDVLETAQKLQGSEFMSYGDNLISLITSLAGYIAHQKLTGKIKNESDFDIDAASENIDGEGLAYGEQFSAGINNESNPANQAEILKKEGARLQWFLMSFNMNAHQNFLVAVKNIFTKGLDSETRNMNARIAAGYLAQAVTYRTLRILVSLAISKGIEAALGNDLDDDEEENKRLKKMLVTMGADIAISDLFLASQNVITQWAIKAALYGSWEIFSKYNLENLDATPEEKKKLEKETVLYDPKFNPILNPDLEVGAAGIVFGDVVEDMKNFARYSEMEKAKREVNPYARDMAFKYGLMIGGFGTLNKVYNGIISQNKRDLRKIYELYDSFKTMNLPEITKLMRTDWRQYNNEERKEFAQLSTDIDTPLNNEGLPNYVFYALTKDQIPKYYDLKEKLTEMFDRGEFEILEELYSYKKNELLSSGKASTENVDMIINNFYKDPKNVKKAIQDIAFSKFVMNSDERKKMQKVKVTAKTK
jgi:hypothetical protein